MGSNKPRVCFFLGGREGGGSAASTLQLIQGIDRDRFDVCIAVCEDGPYTARLRQAGQHCDVLNVGWPPAMRRLVGASPKRAWLGSARMASWIPRASAALMRYVRANRVDIVHSNYLHFHLVAGLAGAALHRKCVWHWRGVVTSSWARRTGPVVRRFTARYAWSIANSRATFESVRPFSGDRLSLVYNGVVIREPGRERGRLRRMLGLPPGAKIVGLVGSLNPIKGHTYFLRAAARICTRRDDVHFVYIGGETAAGQQSYLASLHALTRELQLDGRMHFLGHRPDAAELTAGFDVATVCTLPPGEGFGLVIIEAMANAVPVVSTNVGAAVEIVTDGVTGLLVPPADAEALAKRTDELLDDEARRAALGRAGYALCCERFDIRKTVQAVEDVYRRVLAM